ncbi:hypothetical protein ALI22I_21825 [Saccharothrix sp. ALI-22-I]|uniref:DUF3099 domain-containing protein n=1 Tax=Saccharothrix sp. ALI-22-I TaxID=1933778 RepID=UPI00097BFDF2|nr:DUF3099 domain-containing protein [Saccharothrix sp. ALI-22-I]ONI87110.1 hypothetical protein ALI22I_21825 [Saccharothrix sp. ALI-22-I]
MVSPERDGTPVLITEAEPSFEEQHAARKRKYAIMMGARIPCLILAMVFYQTWWLALAFIVLSVPLPWMAVLIANDRPPRKAEKANRLVKRNRAIEARPHHVIEG